MTYLSRAELEARRLRAAKLLESNLRQVDVAKRLGISRTSVSRWVRRAKTENGMRRRIAPGRPRRLDHTLIEQVYRDHPDRWPRNRRWWTSERLAQAIADRFGIHYHPDHISKILKQLRAQPPASAEGDGLAERPRPTTDPPPEGQEPPSASQGGAQ